MSMIVVQTLYCELDTISECSHERLLTAATERISVVGAREVEKTTARNVK